MRMKFLLAGVSAGAMSLMATPAIAQDAGSSSSAGDLAAMKAELARLAARVEALQQDLDDQQREAAAASVATAASAPPAADAPAPQIAFKGAPEIEADGGWTFKPFGRLQYDVGFTSVPSGTGRSDGFGSELRRARLGVAGDMPGGFGYKFEVDFAGGAAEITDALITYKDGATTYTVGQQNNFQSLEELNSSRFTSTIERAAFTDAFGFERRIGASVQHTAGDVLLQGGIFTDNYEDLADKNWSLDGRVVYSPKIGDTRVHLGGSIHYASLTDDGATVRYRQRPLVHFTSERFIDTGAIAADSEFGVGLEAAMIRGPFHAVTEGYWQNVGATVLAENPGFFGGYGEVGYFLTSGDTRGYKGGKFDRVKPAKAVGDGGIGAVEIVLRYDYLDLNDGLIIGGIQNSYQASLIWTPTAYTRLMLNYGRMDYDDAVYPSTGGNRSYGVDAFGVRAMVDF